MDELLDKIFCCDYQELFDAIPDASIDLVLTDPPYGINYQNNYTSQRHEVLEGDEQRFDYKPLGQSSMRVLKQNTAAFVFTGWSEYPYHFVQLSRSGLSLKEPLICQKRPAGTHDLKGTFQTNSDWILFGHKGRFQFRQTALMRNKRAGTIPNKGRSPVPEFKTRFPSCWFGDQYPFSSENPSVQKEKDLKHPTIKSLEFCKWMILMSTDPGAVVLDPFVGSGTVALAAKLTDRHFIAGDKNLGFAKMAQRRVRQGF